MEIDNSKIIKIFTLLITTVGSSSTVEKERASEISDCTSPCIEHDQFIAEDLDQISHDSENILQGSDHELHNPEHRTSTYNNITKEEKMLHAINQTLSLSHWLADIPLNSTLPKSRTKRRFLSFPEGSYMEVYTSLDLNIQKIADDSNIGVTNRMFYKMPVKAGFLTPTIQRIYTDHERHHVFQDIEAFIDKLNYDGHQCVLRAICEIAEIPFDHGLVGEIVNYVMSVAVGPNDVTSDMQYNDYAAAEYLGHHYGECDTIYWKCPLSFINIISYAYNIK